jgi:coproporphyrinogen III oxidase
MSAAVLPTERMPTDLAALSQRAEAKRWIAGLHDELTSFFGRLDKGGTFTEDRWERPGGGGGVARVMTDGVTFEKAGINRSAVMGELPELAARPV